MVHSEHEWCKDQMAAHAAGGLSAEERARFEAHAAGCAECIAERDAVRRFDRGMDKLFAPVRPPAGLEDRVIRSLRTAKPSPSNPVAVRILMSMAAALFLGITGYVVMIQEGNSGSAPPMGRVAKSVMKTASPALQQETTVMPSSGETLAYQKEDLAGKFRRDAGNADHNESADDEDFHKMKSDSLDFVSDRPFKGKGTCDVIGGGGGRLRGEVQSSTGTATLPVGPEEEKYYSFRNDAGPAPKPPQPLSYFKPADTALAYAVPPPEPPRPEKGKKTEQAAGASTPAQPQEDAPPPQARMRRMVIRSGEMEFEVDSFDNAVAQVVKIAEEANGFVATVNSEKLPNGKVRGTVVVRCPPESLDRLVLQLRALGELKSQRIGSQDVSKMYSDLESRLRAARTMEERLLKILKDGSGPVKDLLNVERELGEWCTRIESIEGEIRYYNNLISQSTLTLTLYEKDIRALFGVTETERVEMGLEVEDVEKAHRDAMAAVAEAKGRVTKSELKQHGPGQFNAIVNAEVPCDAAGPLRDRLKQLGTLARLEIQRDQQAESGAGRAGEVKVKREDARFFLSLYNPTNIAPRETIHVNIACVDAEKACKEILAAVEKSGGRVVTSNLTQPKREQTIGTIQFEVRSAGAEEALAYLKTLGEVMKLQSTEASDTANATRSKRGFNCRVFALGMVAPRETAAVQLACRDVPDAYQKILAAVRKAGGRLLSSNLDERDRHNVVGTVDFEARRDSRKEIDDAMAAAGPVYSRNSSQSQDNENVVDSKTRLQLTLLNVDRIPPRETHTLAIETGNPERRVAEAAALAAKANGKAVGPHLTKEASGRIVAKATLDVPLKAAAGLTEQLTAMGDLRVMESSRNPRVPESDLAIAQFDVTFSNEVMVPSGSGPWSNIKKGLSVSLTALSWALTLVVVGLCLLAPLALVVWGVWKLYRKLRPRAIPQ